MYIKLIIGDMYSVFVKGKLNLFLHTEICRPVVFTLAPNEADDINSACTVFRNSDRVFRLFEKKRFTLDNMFEHLFGLFHIVIIADRIGKVKSYLVPCGVVDKR